LLAPRDSSQGLKTSLVPRWLKNNRNSDEFWHFIQPKLAHYRERTDFIREQLAPLFERAEGIASTPADASVSEVLAAFNLDSVHQTWTKAMERRDIDPEGAITVARTLLEEVCKHILDELKVTYSPKDDLPDLYHATSAALNLAPSQHSEKTFKQILGGATSVVQGLGSLRNSLSDAHGQGKDGVKPLPRHAELAVNLSGAMASFLVATYQTRIAGQPELLQRPENIERLTRTPSIDLPSR
jgi:hypothetical protein